MDFGTAMNIVILITNINSYCIVCNYINKLYTYAPYILFMNAVLVPRTAYITQSS